MNIVISLFNLVPAFPLDGGRMLRGLLWERLGKARATRAAASAGNFFAFVLMGMGVVSLLQGFAVVGLLALRDVLRLPHEERDTTAVQSIMSPLTDRLVVHPDEPLMDALARIAATGAGRLLVMEDGRLVGLLTMSAVIRQARVRGELG